MADSEVSALTAATPVGTDLLYLIDDPGGTPSSKRATVQSVIDLVGEVVADDPTELDIATVGTTTTFTIEDTIARRALTINPQAGTTYTAVASDAAALVSCANASPITVTLPAGVLNLGETITFLQYLAGAVSFVAGAGATVVQEAAYAATTRGQYAVVQAILIDDDLLGTGVDVWLLVGGLAAA